MGLGVSPRSAIPCHYARQALGLAVAGALALGYSNIFVTAPSPENLRTLFEFVTKVRAPPHNPYSKNLRTLFQFRRQGAAQGRREPLLTNMDSYIVIICLQVTAADLQPPVMMPYICCAGAGPTGVCGTHGL